MDAGDEAEIEALMKVFYSAFDNRAGRKPDLQRLREIFSPMARIVRVSPAGAESWSLDEFIEPRIALLTDGSLTEFHEWEVRGRTWGEGALASRWSEYAKSGVRGGVPIRGAGRKLVHLYRLERRWLIASSLWEDY